MTAIELGIKRIKSFTRKAEEAIGRGDSVAAQEALHHVEVQARTVASLLVISCR